MYPEQMHIFLAEDDQDDRLFFKDAFDEVKLKNTLTIFENGESLMDHLAAVAELPHIIFLDLKMPGKTGMECLREIRSKPELRNISVVIYSVHATDDMVEEAFIAGANVFVKKTNDMADLKRIISDIININWQYITDGLNRENFMISY